MQVTENKLTDAEAQLISIADGDPERAALLVEALEEKRRQERFVCYWEPHEEQKKFWEQLTPEQDTWLILGGNGSGKTELGEFLVAAWALGKEFFRNEPNWKWIEPLPIPDPPNNIRGVGLNSDSLRDPMWEKLTGSTEHAPFFPESQVTHRNNQQFSASFANFSKFQGKSADVDPKTHGGPSCALVHIDEECHYEIFKESQRRIRNGGRLLITATPLDDPAITSHPWIFDLIEQWRGGDPSIGVIFMAMEKNPYLDRDFVRREKTRLAGLPDSDARLFGIPVRRSGLVYPRWKPAPPLWVPARELSDADYYRVVTIDPASTGYAAAVWTAYDRKGHQIVYRTYKEKGLTVGAHVNNILAENRGDLIDFWGFDPYMGKQKQMEDHRTVLQVWRDAGLPRLRLCDVTAEKSLEASRQYLDAAFDETDRHPSVEVFDHCNHFQEEIERYIIDVISQGSSKGEPRDRPRKRNDHVMNAWQYACGMGFRARRSVGRMAGQGSSNYFGPAVEKPVPPKAWREEPW